MEALKTSRRPQGKVFTSLCFAFEDRNFFQQKLRSFLTVYLLLALSFLLIITLFAVSLSRGTGLSFN